MGQTVDMNNYWRVEEKPAKIVEYLVDSVQQGDYLLTKGYQPYGNPYVVDDRAMQVFVKYEGD